MTDIRINLNQIETDDINTSVFASKSEVNLVQDNVSALDNNAWVNSNDYSTYTTLTSLVDTVQANLTSLVSAAPSTLDTLAEIAAALENDANIAVTLTTSIGAVQDNVTALSANVGTANTKVYVGETALSNSHLLFAAGSGISLEANSTNSLITFSASMGNATSQEITANGSSNAFTLSKSVANNTMVLVSYNGLVQKPTTYSIDGTTLTISNTAPIESGSDIEVRFFDFFDLPGTSEGG